MEKRQSLPTDIGIADKIFEYLRKTVAGFVEPITTNTKLNEIQSQGIPVGLDEEVKESNEPSTTSMMTSKRRMCVISSSSQSHQKRSKNSRINSMPNLNDSGTGCRCTTTTSGACNCEKILVTCTSGQVTPNMDFSTDRVQQLNSSFCNFIWILKYLESNPMKTNDEMTQMITTLCKGLCDIVNLSHLDFTDHQHRRALRITDTLFAVANSYKDQNPLVPLVHVYDKIETVFDSFLDQLSQEKLNVELQIYRYASVSGLILAIKDIEIRKLLIEKLLLRIHSTVAALWKACVFFKNSLLMDPDVINLFYFYCQLLEAAVTTANWESEQRWLVETVLQNVLNLEEAAGSLFAHLPNIRYILYSVILAAQFHSQSGTTISDISKPGSDTDSNHTSPLPE
ncbi:hypothetical protein Ocin01_05910 [Orchesella cincta]|uniref:Uncharacterized protein n=1 Tax=Orchesella cincta TaxID=48709 RepID=A0A1D2N6R9_ORCCI|nr:hypothetical protein Ocin01_05910 [Orchesella cincta]